MMPRLSGAAANPRLSSTTVNPRLTRRGLLLGALAAAALGGCRGLRLVGDAEAVDTQPAAAERSREAVKVAGRLLFISGGQVFEWADGAARPLTSAGTRYEGPAWSPDGKLIAVSEVGENHSDLWVLDLKGKPIRQLTRHWSHVSVQDSAWGRKPVFSPDGDRIVYVSDLGRTDMSLWSIGVQGAAPRRLYTMPIGSGGVDWPTWSPDGRKIAFVSYPPGPYRPPQIFTWTVATGAVAQITELKDGAFDPAWSPDGAQIAFAGRIDGKTRVMVMRPDGSGLTRLTEGRFDRAPAWSSDSTELAYLSGSTGSFDLWAVHLTRGAVSEPRQLTSSRNADAISGVAWTA